MGRFHAKSWQQLVLRHLPTAAKSSSRTYMPVEYGCALSYLADFISPLIKELLSLCIH